jgi:hypothetical protein
MMLPPQARIGSMMPVRSPVIDVLSHAAADHSRPQSG